MYRVINFNELNSTNVYAREHLEELEHFDIISCDKQTQGHGQFKRVWYSTDKNGGNIYISIVLKPDNLKHLNELTRFIALIGADTLKEYNLNPHFKFPNDILIDNKKIAGFLAESEFFGTQFKGVVVGCGINLNLDGEDVKKIDQSATSIYLEINKRVDKKEFLEKFLNNFQNKYDDFINNGIKEEILC